MDSSCPLLTDNESDLSNNPKTLRGNFKLSTWLLLGALLQGIATLVLPKSWALLPVVLLLLQRTIHTILACYGLTHNPHMDDVLPGRFTAQIPEKDGGPPPTEPAEQDVAIVLLALRSNQYVKTKPRTGVLRCTNIFQINFKAPLGYSPQE